MNINMEFLTPDLIASFITLSLLEIVLGIDNLIFISLVVSRLPAKYSRRARVIGLTMALVIRIIMLMGVKWIMGLTEPIFTLGLAFSFKDLLLIAGGLFLIIKGGLEIWTDLSGGQQVNKKIKTAGSFGSAIVQIMFVDFVFSFDSIITAIAITTNIPVIVAAVVVSMVVMLIASGYLAAFLEKYPGFKVLGISFIILVGVILLAEGFHQHIERAYVYFALAFSTTVEILNTIHRRKHHVKNVF